MARWLKQQGAELRAGQPGFDPGCRRGRDFSSLLRVQTGPGVHSASYKMSTGCFPGGKGGRAQDQPPYLFLVPWLWICGSLHPHPPWAFMACNGDTFYLYLLMYGAETWTMTKEDSSRIQGTEMKFLRSMLGKITHDRIQH